MTPPPRGLRLTRRKKILAVMLEFDSWRMGRTWSYLSSYALLDGFDACGVQRVVMPSLLCLDAPLRNPWVEARKRLLGDERFDQAWVWITHAHYPADFWTWLAEVAPVRVGVLMESLRYTPEEIATWPVLGQRFDAVAAELRHMTHVLSYDEQDVTEIETATGLPTRLYHSMIPARMVADAPAPAGEKVLFLGSLYEKRRLFLEQAQPGDRLQVLPSPEAGTDFAQRFDAINQEYLGELVEGGSSRARMQQYTARLQALRQDILARVFVAYRGGMAVLNLPALFKGFPGRVVEAMAAGVPVLTCRLDHRPRTEAALAHARDVLYYDPNDARDLARQIDRLVAEPGLREALVRGGRGTVLQTLSSEAQMPGLLAWVEETTRRAPRRGLTGALARLFSRHRFQQRPT